MKRKTALAVLVATITLTLGMTACGSNPESATQQDPVFVDGIDAISTEVTESTVTEMLETEDTVTESTEIPVETEEALAEATEVPETEVTGTPEIAVTELTATKYAKSSVNVRKGPGTEYDKVGSLGTNQQVSVTGQAENGWFRIDMNGAEAFVSNKYLSDEKVAVNTSNGNATAGTAENTSPTNDNATSQTPPANNNGGVQPQMPPANNNTSDAGSTPAQSQPSTDNSGLTPDQQEMQEYSESLKESTDALLEGVEIVGGDGSFEPATDGYGDGITITIEPTE